MNNFTNKEKIDFYKDKWKKEHRFETILVVIIAVVVLVAGFVFDNGIHVIAVLGIAIYNVASYNRMMSYVEKRVYEDNRVKSK